MSGIGDKVKVGSVTGTGDAISIEVGWVPDYIDLFVDGATVATLKFFKGMAAASGIKQVGVASLEKIASDGITLLDDDYTDSDGDGAPYYGFIIGADSDINIDTKEIYYVAVKE